MAEDNSNTEVFVYTEGAVVPHDVLRVRVHPSVTIIPEDAFREQHKLEEAELCEGLLVIGVKAFYNCTSLKHINIPSTVRAIEDTAFHCTSLQSLTLPEGIESIDDYALCASNFIQMRLPPSLTSIPVGLFSGGSSLFSIEISENINRIGSHSLSCSSLRNVAIPMNAEVQRLTDTDISSVSYYADVFSQCKDLKQLFGRSVPDVIHALKHRFDNLPIHKMIYYQSYNNMTVEQLNNATNMRRTQKRSLRSKLDPIGSRQDCLGMTPLHILACSTVQNIELYQVLIEQYPENLITKDRWGAVPLLYAIWSDVPSEIIQLLVESYKSLYPNYDFNWTDMVATLSRTKTQGAIRTSLLNIHQEFIPDLDWEAWIEELANHDQLSYSTFRFLFRRGFTDRVNAIGLKQLRDDMMEVMKKPESFGGSKVGWLNIVRSKLVKYEEEYNRLKEATATLELALWKNKINEFDTKKRKRTDESDSDFREQCRISCRADIVIEHVLPFLMPDASSCESERSDGSSSSSDDDNESSDGNESE